MDTGLGVSEPWPLLPRNSVALHSSQLASFQSITAVPRRVCGLFLVGLASSLTDTFTCPSDLFVCSIFSSRTSLKSSLSLILFHFFSRGAHLTPSSRSVCLPGIGAALGGGGHTSLRDWLCHCLSEPRRPTLSVCPQGSQSRAEARRFWGPRWKQFPDNPHPPFAPCPHSFLYSVCI